MRLHLLEATAFGPFSGEVRVDFDHLSDAGLFLLSGPTGAGKTSVLDAVCFALYGDVPGDRNAAKRLRSDQAAAGLAPRVTLEATLSGRRFRIVRSPSWERPKRRGTGVTTEPASVSIAERVDGSWVTLSTRLDETGHLVTRLVGMNVAQFTQVAMLPQGRFQAFLRARSEERHRLLQQLFRTGRFEQVERWLRDRRQALRRSSQAAHQRVADLVSRVSEAMDAPLPTPWDPSDLAVPAGDGSILAWVDRLDDEGRTRLEAAECAQTAAAATEAGARQSLEEGRALAERRRRVDAALAERAALTARAEEHAADRLRLDAARRAAAVIPVHRLATGAITTRDRAELAATQATAHAAAALDLLFVDRPALDDAVAEAVEAAAAVKAALPREAALGDHTAAIESAREQSAELAARIEATDAARADLPARLDVLREELEAAREAARATEPATAAMQALQARIDAWAQVASLEDELAVARVDVDAARAAALEAWEAYLELRHARLEGMAAEIAGALVVGDSCPVCGSADHPHKAVPAPGAPDAAAEKAAQRRTDDAKAAHLLHEERLRDLGTALAVARQAAGDVPPADLRATRDAAAAELARVQELAARVEPREHELAAAEAERRRLDDELAGLRVEAGRLGADLAHREAQAGALRDEVDALLRGSGAPCLSVLHEELLTRVASGRTAREALDALTAAQTAVAETGEALAAAVADAGFADPDDALRAAETADEIAALTARVREHERRLAAVTTVLAEPGADEVAERPAPDLDALTSAHEQTLAVLGEARAELARWTRRAGRLAALRAELGAALEAWAPLRADLEVTSRLAAFVDGKSPDNRLQMRLSAYVLTYRLSQVVAAANARLAGMSDQRYSLEHTGRRGAGETRGGLSILVRDDWSGESRDPATLSGGETFVVSLALALGLADVVTQEAGGADLDTLFVDEGFGSLDADTLDDVMDTLDSLRDGGRVVGVVSHVAEMRDRIPTQLLVSKSRHGSTVALSR